MSTATTIQARLTALQRWDAAVLRAASRFESRVLRTAMRALTRAGDTSGWIVHGLVLWTVAGLPDAIVASMVAAAMLAAAASQLVKRSCRRGRPSVADQGLRARACDPDPWSFPSGHSTVAFAVATAAAAGSPVLGAVEFALATSIAFSRIYLRAHYPVDVLAGIAIGVACGLGAAALVR